MKRNETELRSPGCPHPCPIWERVVSANGSGIKAGLEVRGSCYSSVARWPFLSWVLPTILPVSRDQNSTFSNILQPAFLMPRSKGNFCPSCKRETKRQLNAVSPSSVLPGGIEGTPLKELLREIHLTKA